MIDKNRIVEPLPIKSPQVERRRHTRWTLERPCKMRRSSGITFEPARTINVAPGGVRLTALGEKRYDVGDRVEIAIAWDGESVVGRDALLIGRIVRIMPGKSGPSLAIQFEQPMSLDAAVLDPAA